MAVLEEVLVAVDSAGWAKLRRACTGMYAGVAVKSQ